MAPELLHRIDDLLRTGKMYSASTLAGELGITTRHLKNCIKLLRDSFKAPIPFAPRKGYSYTDTTFALKRIVLTKTELEKISRALLAAREFSGVGTEESFQWLADALIDGGLPAVTMRVSGAIHSAPGIAVSEPLLGALTEARRLRRKVRIVYWSAHNDEVTERTVCPYLLHNRQGELFLIGWCELRSSVRDFLLTRIRDWQVIEGEAAYTTAGFDADAYISKSFGVRHGEALQTVKIRFTPYQARWIRERQYHASQTIEEASDGGLILAMHVSGTFEVKRWVMSFGPDAEVLEPQRLRDELAEDMKKLFAIYVGGSVCSPERCYADHKSITYGV
jgi:predicted DNA-binding transcriptional regulator YafY